MLFPTFYHLLGHKYLSYKHERLGHNFWTTLYELNELKSIIHRVDW